MNSKEYSDRSFLITNINDGIKRIYRSRDCVLQVEEKQLACGDVIVEEKPFVPKTVRKKGGCTTCVNCGRC